MPIAPRSWIPFLTICALAATALRAQGEPRTLKISLKTGAPDEAATRTQLERLISEHDLGRFLFTRDVAIEQGTIPHSHPVLTLSTRHLRDDDLLLSTFVHEQIHWFLAAHGKETEAAKRDLRKLYPRVPVGFPAGADDEDSTYLHLLVNRLECEADRSVFGELRTWQVFQFWAQDHYTWIYQQVNASGRDIAQVLRKHGLTLPPSAGR